MKKRSLIVVSVCALGFSYLLMSYSEASENEYENILNENKIEIPADVQSVLKEKCIGCHNSESKSSKSKQKLNFDKFTNGDYSNGKLISKLGKISKQLTNNKMPPKKYLGNNPDKKLTAEESKLIIDWATEQADILAGE